MLAGAIFVSVTSQFLPNGLLPDMARELGVSQSRVGLLVTVFAITVVVSTTPLAALTRRISRKHLVLVVLLVNGTAALLAASAPSYELLVGARVLGGLAHGLFWAVVGAYSAHLVPKHLIGRAVAITSFGGTAAFVLGVPIGTALGHALGWRLAFASVGVVMLILVALVLWLLPPVDHRVTLATGEIQLPARRDATLPAIIAICVVIVIIMTGQNVLYTYIAPWLISVGAVSEAAVAGMLFVYGGAGVVGLLVAGVLADRYPRFGFVAMGAACALSVLLLALGSSNQVLIVIAVGCWGAAFGGLPALFQARMLHTASPRLRDFGSALFTTSFNIAIGVGALVGGVLIDAVGLAVLPYVLVALVLTGVVVNLVAESSLRGRALERPSS
ncbi:MFS transporter [soil metagenome]